MQIEHHPNWKRQVCTLGSHTWNVAGLVAKAKDLPVLEVPIDAINVYKKYENITVREVVGHIKAVNEADLSFPIILDEDGEVLDGWHRIMKSILLGKETIKIVRFQKNPPPDRI